MDSTSTPSIAVLARAPTLVHIIVLDREEISSSETLLTASSDQEWIIDSGATRNMSPVKDGLIDYLPQCGEVLLGDNTSLPILGIGNLCFLSNGYGGSYTLIVLHVPSFHYNLLFVHELCKLGLSLKFVDDKFLVRDKHRKVLLEGVMNIGLYKISILTVCYLPLVLLWLFGMLNLVILMLTIFERPQRWWMVYLLLVDVKTCVVLV